jgi:Ni/Fe-hydrogenase b-type cytochrome subunit
MEEPIAPGTVIVRHRVSTRLWHWINALAIFTLLGSGATISNAHRRLYWGQFGANMDHAWLNVIYWPGWVTIPSRYNLALARRWHLFFALIFAFGLLGFMVVSLINRHFQRDLKISKRELAPRHLWADIRAHLALRFHDPDHPRDYNILQKFAYAGTIFVLLPVAIFSGLTLSPGMDAAWPWLLDLFGGRQSARSIHFIAAGGIAAFIVVHLTLVILAGVVPEVMSMITGRWRIPAAEERA